MVRRIPLTDLRLRRSVDGMATPKKSPRTKRDSGFPAKLRAFLARNYDEFLRAGHASGPHSGAQLARYLTDRGEPVSPNAVNYWKRGVSLPAGEYVGLLEVLMGAPWSVLNDPGTALPTIDEAAAYRAWVNLPASRRLAVLSAARAVGPARPPRE